MTGFEGGRYRPLTDRDAARIHTATLDVLERIGIADPIPSVVERVTGAGGWLNREGRLCFSRALVEDTIARTAPSVVLCGQDPARDIELGGTRVHCGTGGAAPSVVDMDTGRYRPATLADLYDLARLVDALDNLHFYVRSVVATDMPTTRDLDLNTAYACMRGTAKPIGASFVRSAHVEMAVEMFDMALGGAGRFRARPFCKFSCCHVVAPLRFAQESCEALEAAVRLGMPVMPISCGQAGATSPAALAGSVVQAMAEALAGLVLVKSLDSDCPTILGMMPLVSDLRTGAMSGGGGEQAVLMAACAQMAGRYDLPGTVNAGMADAKIPDAQSGGEKGCAIALAAHAGANMVQQSAGSHASLLGISFEGHVIDDDLLGAVQRTVRGIEVTDETLSLDAMRAAATGPQSPRARATLAPPTDRRDRGIRERAIARTREILSSHYPAHLDPARDRRIRATFDIRLPEARTLPGGGCR